MMTTRGDIPEADLRKIVTSEAVPCGICHTTQFFAEDGELVRQDISIAADPELIAKSMTNPTSTGE